MLVLPPAGEPDGAGGAWDRAPRVLGVARWLAAEGPSGPQLELETELFAPRTRVHHVERLARIRPPRPAETRAWSGAAAGDRPGTGRAHGGPKLVWREVRASEGRTVVLEWDDLAGSLRSTEWNGAEEARRRLLDPDRGLLLPLWTVEGARGGAALEGRLPLFNPLAGGVEELSAQFRALVLPLPWPGLRCAPLQLLSWRRSGGALAGEYLFAGPHLLAFRWQAGGPVALRVGVGEYRGLLRWGRDAGAGDG